MNFFFCTLILLVLVCVLCHRCNTHEPPLERTQHEIDMLEQERVDQSVAAAAAAVAAKSALVVAKAEGAEDGDGEDVSPDG